MTYLVLALHLHAHLLISFTYAHVADQGARNVRFSVNFVYALNG